MRSFISLFASLALLHAGQLHEAVRTCDAKRMQQLLATAPSLNEPDENGLTPLHVAIDARKSACVALLLDAGANKLIRDGKGRLPQDAAFQIPDMRQRAKIRRYLTFNCKKCRKMAYEPAGPKPWTLEYAVQHRQVDIVKMLLSLGADPDTISTAGTTLLADAALKGDLEIVRALLERGAMPNAKSKTGTLPIHDAALGGNSDVVRDLIKQGADKNARTQDEGQTPLHIAAAMGKQEAAEALVSLGADLTIKDAKDRTPLATAERAGLTEMASFLRQAVSAK